MDARSWSDGWDCGRREAAASKDTAAPQTAFGCPILHASDPAGTHIGTMLMW
ncbi:hypothetical protein GCM10022403_046470 [Streptomyces coacervatus]|uniref:Uncharacterized protein n=1 Tax=Streptomyces coacervatus TaxID=647381 RepID=A0ABP7I1H0_9ACTN